MDPHNGEDADAFLQERKERNRRRRQQVIGVCVLIGFLYLMITFVF
ncbi:MAG: hypothetical protein OYG31_01910 [Candidatus Kaiserbacteria bacterium]|nr:hypothetical protein [Candidatus Kaiserbacteria bacterium]